MGLSSPPGETKRRLSIHRWYEDACKPTVDCSLGDRRARTPLTALCEPEHVNNADQGAGTKRLALLVLAVAFVAKLSLVYFSHDERTIEAPF